MTRRDGTAATCSQCTEFEDDPAQIERAFPGILALSSAWASTRGRAGICRLAGTFQDPQVPCQDFTARGEERARPPLRAGNKETVDTWRPR